MNTSYTPTSGAKAPGPATTRPEPSEATWIGYESALPWIRIPLPLARTTPRPR